MAGLRGTSAGRIVGMVVAVVIGMAAAMPVLLDLVESAGVTGTAALALGFVPLFFALLVLVAIARPVMRAAR